VKRGGHVKRKVGIYLGLIILFLSSTAVLRAEQALSLGYGIAAFNTEKHVGRLGGGNYYDFIRGAYLYEKPLLEKKLSLAIEPFGSYVNRPTAGAEGGLGVGLMYYPFRKGNDGFFISGGPGIAYTSVQFQEQGTHLLFIVQGGFGYRYKDFFIENRIRHYSNGGTVRPNWSVNSNILSIGFYY
jgi:hypothetical protein